MGMSFRIPSPVKIVFCKWHCWCRFMYVVQDDPIVDYFAPHLKQHPGICVENANLKDKKHFKFTLSPSFIHALFMSTSVSHPDSSPQSTTFIITLTFSLPFCVFALYAFISPSDGLPAFRHLGPLLSTSLSPAFCLSKGRLLVPYQTLMNYEHPLSSGLDRNTSHCLPASLLKQLRKGNYCNPARNTLFCRLLG